MIPSFAIIAVAVALIASCIFVLRYEVGSGNYIACACVAATTVHYGVLIAYPGIYSVATEYALERQQGVAPAELATVYGWELLYWCFFVFAYIYSRHAFRRLRRRSSPGICARRFTVSERTLSTVFLVGGAIVYGGQLLRPAFTVHDMVASVEIHSYGSIFDQLADYATSFCRWPALFIASIWFFRRRESWLLWLLSIAIFASELVYAALNGLRGGIVWVACSLCLGAIVLREWKRLVQLSVALLFFLPVLSVIRSELRWYTMFESGGRKNYELIGDAFKAALHPKYSSREDHNFLEAWADRAQGPRNTYALLKEYNDGRSAGILPILGALTLPIPRNVWPEKLVAGSTDQTNFGAAIYLVQRLKVMNSDIEMGPLLASGHAYWEFGLLGVVVAGVLSGALWGCALSLAFIRGGLAAVVIIFCLLAALPIDGFFTMPNPLYTYILIGWKTVLPLLALNYIMSFVSGFFTGRKDAVRFEGRTRSR